MIISASMVYILFLNSEYIIKNENNFTRRFSHHPILEDSYLDLGLIPIILQGLKKTKFIWEILHPFNTCINRQKF
jgi:hypothetical protein